ncbi:hypothetical protein COV88_03745 [Candidatus Saccharibacteria bacterium CG11_big_fil_rev_8_21_14_0_20_41_19]|nr:hypothetical protein [Candidatus Saccharibacteria bacterium]OIP85599.1 MAG: hypothetical protein AUK57_03305 [Candidatus Saccharibacteria bacterium CG2_30_41_52]PIQ70538.1 MAG: hypothetical protein COV88_03745 [Candidatus Saccharibacteria bacterium CG11_big_fil_rev_8_21_14_0_20_41_19]PIZ60231.1 MAG: hypothetical protein COY18_01680 [Candidatus Saccharibacteria bacterium CG_4_10_14_0_2_um_filter_41_11]PJC29432.1 MAG: hypothetical protein CO052_03250 [Candidatus Saccharibacteria bacterium CG_4
MITIKISKNTRKLVFGLLAVSIFTLGSYAGVMAYSGTVFGRKEGYGYFKNQKVSGSSSSKGYVIKSGIKSGINSAKELVDYLDGKNGGSGQDEAGSAFIYYTMMGKNGSDRDKNISGSEWDDLEARINSMDAAGRVNWKQNIKLSINSYHQEYKNSKGKTVHDDAFYSHSSSESSIVFKNKSGKVIYALAFRCANPMGDKGAFEAFPESNQWDVSTKSELVSAPYTPGQTITWKHTIDNKGPDSTDQDVDYRYENSSGLGSGSGSNHTFSSGSNKGKTSDFNSTYTITQNDVGNNLCRATSASPKSWDNSGRTTSSSACVAIPYNYSLTPSLTANVSGAIEANTSFNVTPAVISTGPTKSKNTQWQITQIVVVPGGTVPNSAGGNSDSYPCGPATFYFRSLPNAACSTIGSGTTVFNEAGTRLSGSIIAAQAVVAGDYEVGTKICYAFSVQPRASSVPANPGLDNQWRHSAPVCVVIGKKPKVQIWGGDLVSGGLVRTSTSVKNIGGVNRTFGSWDEYGIFAVNSINGMGSGSAFADAGLANATVCNYSMLSFTNAGSTTCGTPGNIIGGFVTSRATLDVASSFSVNPLDLVHNLGNNPIINLSVGGMQGSYSATGGVSVAGGGAGKVIAKGQWVVINVPNSDVTITGNINYTSEALATINDIPQVVIVARNINIVDTVTNVDAWLITTGDVNTCSSFGAVVPLTSNMCNQQLTVNGPVIANKLYLRRTAGSGTGGASGDPAELFNMRPDAYMWAYARATSSGHAQTVHTIELPPRY